MAVDVTKIRQSTILGALNALHIPDAAATPGDQARQFFRHFLADANTAALHASDFYKGLDWSDANALPGLFRFKPFQTLLGTAVNIPAEKMTFSLSLELLYKVSAAIWHQALPTLTYPTIILDSTARQRFKDSLKNSQHLKSEAYPLEPAAHELIANIIDAYHVRRFQKLELNALNLNQHDPLDILKNQPRFSSRVQQEITRFISAPLKAESHSIFYSAIVHGYVEDGTLISTSSIAALVKDYLLTGVRPHEHAGKPWASMQVSVYEDAHVRAGDGTDRVNPEDLLKSSPINYSDFTLHPFTPVSLTAFDDFLQRLDELSSLYRQDIERYWASVSADAGAKKVWVDHLKHYIETEARLRLADGTLTLKSHILITRILSHPTAQTPQTQTAASGVDTYTCALVDRSNGRAFAINGSFLLEQQDAAGEQCPLVVFNLDAGATEFASWAAFEQHLLAQMEDDDRRPRLLERLSKKNAAAVLAIYTRQPDRLGLEKTPVTSAIIGHMVDGLLAQQRDDFLLNFDYAKRTSLHQGLKLFCNDLDPCLASTLRKKHSSLSALRHTRALEQLPGKALSDALALSATPLKHEFSTIDLSTSPFVFSDVDVLYLNDGACRDLMVKKLGSEDVTHTVKSVLDNIQTHFPADMPVTVSLSALILKRISDYRDNLRGRVWQSPGSYRHNFHYFQTLKGQLPNGSTRSQTDSAALTLLGLHKRSQEQIHPYYSSRELTKAQGQSAALVSVSRDEINVTHPAIDLAALATYLSADLLANVTCATAAQSPYHELLLDLPGLHRLGKVLMAHTSASAQTLPATAARALAVCVITDYLYPPSEQQSGYICGMNLNSVESGETSFNALRDALNEHLEKRFAGSTDNARTLAFTLLSARYAPELLVVNVPDALLYGQTLDSVHLRHAVACMEATQPYSSVGLSYLQIASAYANVDYRGLSESKNIAIALLKQLPTLHYAMCQGVIRETDIASVSHDNSLKAIAYVTEQEALEAQTFTHLVQKPPRRKDMASAEFKKNYPGVDAERIVPFTEVELKKYFHVHPMLAADRHIGRRMRMTLLEKYMSCVSGVGFTEQELGLKPYPQGACQLQARFDGQFATYKHNFLSGMVSRLASALHGTPSRDRNRILKAYKFIKVSFKNSEDAWEESHFGLIALYKESESVQYAYEIFCPSGTIRSLPLTAKSPTRIHVTSSPPTADALWHESPYLYVPPLNEGAYLRGSPDQKESAPYLMVSFYTLARQTRDMTREQKIQLLSQKMVDAVFSPIMALVYPDLKSPTAYEAHKERMFARAQLMASFALPGYTLYQDIKSGKVTLGTIITSALEILSVLLPFVGLGIKALSISIHLGRVIILSKSLNLTKTALTAAKAIQPLHSALPTVLLRSLTTTHPASALSLLFQIGHKGLLGLKYLLKFARAELASGASLSKGIPTRFLPPLDYRPVQSLDVKAMPGPASGNSHYFFRPDAAATAGQLNIQQQMRLQSSHIDVSDVSAVNHVFIKNGTLCISLQGNMFTVRRTREKDKFQLYKNTENGPYVKFNHAKSKWEITC
ncbi:hypothetical protein BFW87_27770 [Pseudomonas fluorescens]|uniref:Dermonecrotic toxin N-terminal domain-containing protein n=1 Tax=Pseudomonas fluorescens TaxID=294 RepID=A0A1T2XZH4_PSEFL|nr:DUF6543 domain-containing protein [Pseudomonas fluorescens]OPA85232.1 hypothetical protein BFW87_27770 [Pseudomonas fluorescens]